MYITMYTLDCC